MLDFLKRFRRRCLPPTTVHYGEHEILAGDGAGRVPEVDAVIQQMGAWLRRHLGG